MIQKYHGRALLVLHSACAIHCRYCFRREFDYSTVPHGISKWQPVLESIRQDSSLHEIILSGGDPLMMVNSSLTSLIEQLAEILGGGGTPRSDHSPGVNSPASLVRPFGTRTRLPVSPRVGRRPRGGGWPGERHFNAGYSR